MAHLEEYFGYTGCPEMQFNFEHEGEYDSAKIDRFYDAANQFALKQVRGWLGITQGQR